MSLKRQRLVAALGARQEQFCSMRSAVTLKRSCTSDALPSGMSDVSLLAAAPSTAAAPGVAAAAAAADAPTPPPPSPAAACCRRPRSVGLLPMPTARPSRRQP